MPTRDPDDGEISDVDEFVNTLSEVEYDDVLLSLLGEGRNLDVPGDVVDQQLANALSSWRNDGDREPVRDEAIGQKHPAGGAWPPATTGGTLSVSESAGALRRLATDMPLHQQQEVANQLEQLATDVAAHLGSDHPGFGRIQGAIDQARNLSSNTYAALETITQVTNEVADSLMRG